MPTTTKNKLYRLITMVSVLVVSGLVLALNGYQLVNQFFGNINTSQTIGRISVDEYLLPYEVGDLTYGSEFGSGVSIDQNLMVVGAKNYSDVGAAFIYSIENDVWIEDAVLTPSNFDVYMNFGHAVSIYGNRVAVGAPRDYWKQEGAGSVFIYELVTGNWVQTHEIFPSLSADNDSFGYSVVLFEDQLFVGSPTNYRIGGLGSAYHFKLDNSTSDWVEIDVIKPDLETEDGYFGSAIDFNSDRLLVGSPFADGSAAGSGSAYLFEFNGDYWEEKHQFIASDGLTADWFGDAVSLWQDRVLIGAWGHDNLHSKAGAAYVFELENTQWVEKVKLEASDGVGWFQFGEAVDLVGNTILVSAPRKRIGSAFEGAEGGAYLFEYDGLDWQETSQFNSSNDFPNQNAGLYGYGKDVVLNNNNIYVASPNDAPIGSFISSGAIHQYGFANSSWTETDLIVPAVVDAYFGGLAFYDNQLYVLSNINGQLSILIYENSGVAWIQVNQIATSGNCGVDRPNIASPNIANDFMFISGTEKNVCVFERTNGVWTETGNIQPSDVNSIFKFGKVISAHGNRLAISARISQTAGIGRVYMFEYINGDWVEVDQLESSDQTTMNELFFGRFAIELLNDTLLVGAHADNDIAESSGAVYVFEHDGIEWVEVDKLKSSDAEAGDWFGSEISLSEDVVVIGAQKDDVGGVSGTGSVYIFTYTNGTWTETAKLVADDGTEYDGFGTLIDINNNRLLISAPYDDTPNNESGSAYLFEFQDNQWIQIGKVLPSIPVTTNRLGLSGTLDNNSIFMQDHDSLAIFTILDDLIFSNGF